MREVSSLTMYFFNIGQSSQELPLRVHYSYFGVVIIDDHSMAK